LALDINADGALILTDGGKHLRNFGKPDAMEMAAVTPEYLKGTKTGKNFPGSIWGPRLKRRSDSWRIAPPKMPPGDLKDAAKIASNEEGTLICKNVEGNAIWREHLDEEAAAAPSRPDCPRSAQVRIKEDEGKVME
jgi:carbamate kinase